MQDENKCSMRRMTYNVQQQQRITDLIMFLTAQPFHTARQLTQGRDVASNQQHSAASLLDS